MVLQADNIFAAGWIAMAGDDENRWLGAFEVQCVPGA